jgi:hypothetical protein
MYDWSKMWNMDFNPTKCKILTVTRRSRKVQFDYSLNGTPLEHVGTFTDLGVVVDEKLSFSPHVEQLISKCNKMCGFIKRSIGFTVPSHVKFCLYQALCLSHLDYCSPVWSPQNATLVRKIESVQRSMSKYILNSYEISYVQRCTDLHILPLCFRREINDLVFFFKCLHGSVRVDFSTDFTFVNPTRGLRSARGELLAAQPVRTESFKASYFNRIVRLWNILPAQVRQCTTVNTFKENVTLFYADKLLTFNTEIFCTWTSTCRCQGFYHA